MAMSNVNFLLRDTDRGGENSIMQNNLKEIHELIANTGYFIIGLHAAAAIFYHSINAE
ncbi:hydrogenase [Yersinia entomophaga]|uniref:Hydrogenase n=1 Tax=Yersinia entomophaga TaxID=935293 RepID=A0ABN4PNR6_YERET|nr:hydrogenase [Yersinia entomophaga]